MANLTREAESFLRGDSLESSREQQLQDLADRLEELPASEQQQLQELGRLARLQPESAVSESLRKDAVFEITLSADRMTLLLSVQPALGRGKALEREEVLRWLWGQGIRHGIKATALNQALADADKGRTVQHVPIGAPLNRVAEGNTSRTGRDLREERTLSGRFASPNRSDHRESERQLFPPHHERLFLDDGE